MATLLYFSGKLRSMGYRVLALVEFFIFTQWQTVAARNGTASQSWDVAEEP